MSPKSNRLILFCVAAAFLISAALLTLSYMGYFQKMDPTFIASIFSGSLAGYGISRAVDNNTKTKKPKLEESDNTRTKP